MKGLQPAKKTNVMIMIIKIRFRWWLVPIVHAVLEEFKQMYHLLQCFPDVSSLVEPVARMEEMQRI